MYTMIDLFAGAGGLSAGLEAAGFRALYANEIQPRYVETYSRNHPGVLADGGDIRSVDAKRVRDSLGLRKGDLSLLAGGPPCQGFSIYAPKRCASDERNHLFKEYLRFVDEFQPEAVLIENVPGLVSFERGDTLSAILQALAARGYCADVRILYAPHFGVPQTRWRTIILALGSTQMTSAAFPEPNRNAPARVNFTAKFAGKKLVNLPLDTTLPSHVSVRDAIDDLPVIANGESIDAGADYRFVSRNEYQRLMRAGSNGVWNHEAPRLSAINLERLKHIGAGGNWTHIPHDLLPAGMQRARRSDHTKRYGRADPEGLSCTILTKCDPHWGAYFHYSQDRVFTVREAARLQSFADSYHFFGSRGEQYEQVGNAVPPLMAQAIGESLVNVLATSKTVKKKAV